MDTSVKEELKLYKSKLKILNEFLNKSNNLVFISSENETYKHGEIHLKNELYYAHVIPF